MIDENLCRAEMSSAERAKQTVRRKEVYEALHPETRLGENQHTRVRKLCEPSDADRFTTSTALATDKSERVVQLDAERGRKVAPEVLDMIRDTHLDTGSYLDKIKKEAPEEQLRTAARDLAAGPPAKRKPISPSDPPRNDFELENAEHAALVRAWKKARSEARERFLSDIGAVVDQAVLDRRFG
jgi:hypothetical protein